MVVRFVLCLDVYFVCAVGALCMFSYFLVKFRNLSDHLLGK